MYSRSFEEVVIDFVEVGDGADEVCSDVAFVIEGLDAAKDAQVLSFFWERPYGRWVGVAVEPLLDFDDAGTVVDFKGCVGGLLLDGVDLADEGYLQIVRWEPF
jgi:hypothetical protein